MSEVEKLASRWDAEDMLTGRDPWQTRQLQAAIAADKQAQPSGEVVAPTDVEVSAWPPDPGGMRVYAPRGVKIVHKPTGVSVTCEHERSQHANRDAALRAIRAALTSALAHQPQDGRKGEEGPDDEPCPECFSRNCDGVCMEVP